LAFGTGLRCDASRLVAELKCPERVFLLDPTEAARVSCGDGGGETVAVKERNQFVRWPLPSPGGDVAAREEFGKRGEAASSGHPRRGC